MMALMEGSTSTRTPGFGGRVELAIRGFGGGVVLWGVYGGMGG